VTLCFAKTPASRRLCRALLVPSMNVRSIRSRSRGVNLRSSRRSGSIRSDLMTWDCLVGAGYPSSIERERRPRHVQFSTVSPLTRPNSAVLFVTSLSPRLRA
jgi:hypothetical protein